MRDCIKEIDEKTFEYEDRKYKWGERGRWEPEKWMEPYIELFNNTGGNPFEWLMSLSGKDTKCNMILAALCCCASSQYGLLNTLKDNGLLTGVDKDA